MKRAFLSVIILLFVLQFISAININVEKISSDEVIIVGIDNPATIDLRITNMGEGGNFMFYTFFGSGMYPKGTVPINEGETKDIEIGVYPRDDFKQRGHVTFNYFIRSSTDDSEKTESLTLEVTELKDAFEQVEAACRAKIEELYLTTCPKCGEKMKRITDVADVWFDSGAMPFASFHYPF